LAIDNLGRDTGELNARSLLSGLNKQVGEVMETSDSRNSGKMNDLLEAVNNLSDVIGDNLNESSREASGYAQQIISAFENIHKREARQDRNQSDASAAYAKKGVDLIERIYKMGKSPRTFWVGLGHLHPTAVSQFQKILKDCGLCRSGASNVAESIKESVLRRSAGSGGRGTGPLGDVMSGPAGGVMGGGPGGMGFMVAAKGITAAVHLLTAASQRLMNAFNVNVMNAFDGVLSQSNAFRERIRAIVYETRGFGDLNRDIEKQYTNITAAVSATGVQRGKFQQVWVGNLQRGLVMENALSEAGKEYNKLMTDRIKKTMRVQTTAMHTAMQLNMSVDNMNNLFMDWRMHLGMGVLEIQSMGRGMQDVARATGLTGAELEKAVKATDQIMKKMKNAGRLSAESAKAVMGMMAAAQKYGVGDQMGKMMEALSSPRGFLEASNQMKVLLLRSAQLSGDNGLAQRVMFGQATSAQDLNNLAKGFEENMRRTLKGFGIDDDYLKMQLGIEGGLDMTNLSGMIQEMERLDPAKARHLQLTLEQAYGMGIGEIEQLSKAMAEAAEANKPFGERIDKMTQELRDMERAGMGASDAANELRARLQETNTSALQDGFTAWQKAIQRSNGDMVAAQRDLEQRLQSSMGPEMAREFAANIGGKAGELLDDLRARAAAQGKDLDALLQKRGFNMAQIKRAMTSGTAEEMENAMSILNEAQQEIGRKEREGQDPITEIRGQIVDINNKLGSIADSILFAIPNMLMKIIFWTATIGGVITSLLAFFMSGAWLAGLFSGAGIPGGGGLMGMLGGGGGLMGGVGGGGGLAAGASIAGAIAAPIMALVGAVKGFSEAEEAGRTKLGGTLLGILTGGAGTGGGLVGKMFGTEEGTGADKAAGVATAGLWGAGLGAAIGTAIAPGIGTAIGAAIGGVVGMGTQFLKIITAGTTILEDLLQPFQILITYVTENLKDVWAIIKAIFSFDLGTIMDSVLNIIGRTIMLIPSLIWAGLKMIVITLPQLFFAAIKGIFVDLPMFLWGAVKSGLESLANSEWVGPIFETLSEAFNEIYDGVMAIYEPISEAFGAIIGIFQEIGEALFGASDGGTALGFVMDLLKGAIHGLATVIGWALKPVVWLAQAFGAVLKTVGWIVEGIVAPFKWLYDVLVGHSIIPDLVFGIVKFFAMLPIRILEALGELAISIVGFFLELPGKILDALATLAGKIVDFFLELPGKIIAALGDLAGALAAKIGDIITGIPMMLLDAAKSVFVDFPSWLFDTLTGGLADLGTWIWDHTIGALINMIPDWIKNMFTDENSVLKDEGGGTVLGEAGETLSDVAGGAGRMTLGAGGKLLEGDVLGAAGEVLGGAKDMVVGAVDGIIDTGAAVLDAVNPFNWFDAGSREIKNTGVAMVHEGEMIIPKDIWESITAVGGGFGSGGGITDAFATLLNPLGMMGGGGLSSIFNPVGLIGDAMTGIGSVVSGAVDMLNPFNWFGGNEDVAEALPEETAAAVGLYDYLDIAIDALMSIAGSNEAIAENLGAFSPEAPTTALEKGIEEKASDSDSGWLSSVSDMISGWFGEPAGDMFDDIVADLESAFGFKSEADKKSPVADAGKGLYYDMNNPMMTAFNAITNPVGAIASGIGSLFGIGGSGGSISAGSGLNYRDQMKGEVSASTMTLGAMEQRLASEKAGSEGSGTGTAMGMSGVEGLLHEEVTLMGMMYETLEAIKSNTSSKPRPKVIDAPGAGNRPPHAQGVKSIAMDYVRGYWDLTTGDYAPPAVTNDGRGGN